VGVDGVDEGEPIRLPQVHVTAIQGTENNGSGPGLSRPTMLPK
jgi:hypothetical protein